MAPLEREVRETRSRVCCCTAASFLCFVACLFICYFPSAWDATLIPALVAEGVSFLSQSFLLVFLFCAINSCQARGYAEPSLLAKRGAFFFFFCVFCVCFLFLSRPEFKGMYVPSVFESYSSSYVNSSLEVLYR